MLQLLKGEFAFADLRESALANLSGVDDPDKASVFAVVLDGTNELDRLLGTARFQPNERGWHLRLSTFAAHENGVDNEPLVRIPQAMDLAAFPTFLAQFLSSDPASELGHLEASYFFETSRWQSTVALPLPMAGVLDASLGTPQLTGVEFQFDRNVTPMRHVELSLSPERDIMFLRLRMLFALYPTETFFQRQANALTQALQKLVHTIPEVEIAENA